MAPMRQAGGHDAGAAVPLPPAVLRARRSGVLAGRQHELAAIEAAWEVACTTGTVRLLLLEGEPGVGKTRLAAEQATRVADNGGGVLFGRCDEDVPAPFRPWSGVLGDLVALAGDDLLTGHVDAHGGELARVLGTVGGRLPEPEPSGEEADSLRHRVLSAAVGLITAAARRRPVLIVLDDLHCADRASLLLLRELLRGPDAPVLILATIRDVEADHGEAFRAFAADLRREDGVTALAVGGLDRAATRALVSAQLGNGSFSAADALHDETDGNALFVVELVRHMAERGGELDAGALPRTIAEVVGRRADELGADAARVARYAAALGRGFDFELLVHVLDAEADTVLDAVERICAAGLAAEVVDHPGRFQFAHGVTQRALAAELTDLRRRGLHRRAAEWLAATGERDAIRTGELALHWAYAGSDFVEQAVAASVEAGDRAFELLAPDDAVRAFDQALRLHTQAHPEPDEQATELMLRLGDAERRAGYDGYAERLLAAAELAVQRGDTERLVRAAMSNSRGFHSSFLTTDERRVAIIEAALEAVGEDATVERALLLAVLASELFADRDRRLALADEAQAVARAAGDERVLAEVLLRRCFTIAEPDTVAERLQLVAELRRLGERLDDPLVQLRAAVESARVMFEAGRADAVVEAERVIELAPRVGSAFTAYLATHFESVLLHRVGDYEQAEATAVRGAERAAAVAPDAMAISFTLLLPIRWDQGRLGELADAAVQLAADSPAYLGYGALVPIALVEAGREAEARAALDKAVAAGLPLPGNVLALLDSMLWAEGCLALGHEQGARVALEQIAPWRELYVFAGSSLMGSVARLCAGLAALLGDQGSARRDFALAETVDERMGAIGPLARTWIEHGAWLIERGEEAPGRERLERARATAAEHGFAGLEARADAALGANSSPSRRNVDDSATTSASWRREGDVWTLDFGGQVTRLRDAKGIHHVVRLLASPDVEIAAAELAGPGSSDGAREAGDAGPALDAQAKSEYRARITELRDEIEEAEGFNDPERASRAREELEWIGQALSQAVGLGGRDRPQASGAERARVNVTRAIHTTLRRIAEHDPRAGRMLSDSVRTGTFCAYEPDPTRPVAWTLPG